MSVYFAEVGPYIKIGFSRNPERRVRNLFASTTRYSAPADTPMDLASRRLIRAIKGDKGTEFQIHRALEDFNVGTEWFANEPELREWIDAAEYAEEYEPLRRAGGPIRRPNVLGDPEVSELMSRALAKALGHSSRSP